MAMPNKQRSRLRWGLTRLTMLTIICVIAGFVLSLGGRASQLILGQKAGSGPRLVSYHELPEMQGEMCTWLPASANESLMAALQQSQGAASPTGEAAAAARPSDSVKAEAGKRAALRVIRDPNPAFSGIAVDPVRNEVVMADENLFGVLVYDRLENTPPAARMSEPKRIIRGREAYLQEVCGVYIDPTNGDLYAVNNDVMDWLSVFDRNAKGAAPPMRKLVTPHTTHGIAVDEQAQEMLLTVQDDHAVVVFKKTAQETDGPVRILQGEHTQMADPHGIALDKNAGEIFVSNWGTTNDRPPLDSGSGGGGYGRGFNRKDFPVGRFHAVPGSGKILPPSITVYPKGAKGDTPPLRVIQGPKAQLNWPTALAVHPDRKELFVANDVGDSILVFRTDAVGDAAPIRVLKGPKSLIKNPVGVAVDVKNNELWVANFGNHSASVYKIDANGDMPPLRTIRSGSMQEPAPMFGIPLTLSYDTKREEILVAN